jgi:outer membrane protein assembly factor BamB
VIKFDGQRGIEVWRQMIDGTAHEADAAFSAAVDASGDVLAAGRTWNEGTELDFTVVKFDGATGEELWRQVIDGERHGFDVAGHLALDSAGDVVAAGSMSNQEAGSDFTVIKFDGGTGVELWRQTPHGTSQQFNAANDIAIDRSGDVIAVGYMDNTSSAWDFVVIKFDGQTGLEQWRQVIDGTQHGFDSAELVALDESGNPVAGGYLHNVGTRDDFTVIKFDGQTGAEQWRRVINGTANDNDRLHGLKIDGEGNVIAAGTIMNVGTYSDFAVLKFDGRTGAELWRQEVDGPGHGFDAAYALDLDAAGDVLAAGLLAMTPIQLDFAVLKFAGASGNELWRETARGERSGGSANAVITDDMRDVVAAGRLVNIATMYDFAVIKYSADRIAAQ